MKWELDSSLLNSPKSLHIGLGVVVFFTYAKNPMHVLCKCSPFLFLYM